MQISKLPDGGERRRWGVPGSCLTSCWGGAAWFGADQGVVAGEGQPDRRGWAMLEAGGRFGAAENLPPEPGILQTVLLSKLWHSSGLEGGSCCERHLWSCYGGWRRGGVEAHVEVEWSSRIEDPLRDMRGAPPFVQLESTSHGGNRVKSQDAVPGCFVEENGHLLEFFCLTENT